MPVNKDQTEPTEKLEEHLIRDGLSQAGEINVKNDKSVDRALEEFVAQASAASAEDYDGWDLAANISRLVEKARSQPAAREVERTPLPLPGVAPLVTAPPATNAPLADEPVVPPPIVVGTVPRLPFESLPSMGGVSRRMYFVGLVGAALLAAVIAVLAVKLGASSAPVAPPAATVQPPAVPAAEAARPPAPPAMEPVVTPLEPTRERGETAAAGPPAAAAPEADSAAAPPSPTRRRRPSSGGKATRPASDKTHSERPARSGKRPGWVDPFAQ